ARVREAGGAHRGTGTPRLRRAGDLGGAPASRAGCRARARARRRRGPGRHLATRTGAIASRRLSRRARRPAQGRRDLRPQAGRRAALITRWDLDKTYLRTEFDTLGDLVRTALEPADQKRAVPGAATLLHALGETAARVHILSGSPRQLRRKLEDKLRLDDVRWDELTLKPNLSNLLRLRLRALRDQ